MASRKGQQREGGPPKEVEPRKYYHLYDEPDDIVVPIDSNFVKDVVKNEMASCGATNMKKFLNKTGGDGIYYWLQGPKNKMKVRNLKKFCNIFNIGLDELERKGIILGPYPVDMYSIGFIKLKTHILNEGRLSIRKFKSYTVLTLAYSNQDPVLLKYFADVVKEVGGVKTGEPQLETYALVTYASPVLARALLASGLPPGRKTRSNPSLDPLVGKNLELVRYHIIATLTEEGWSSLRISNKRVKFVIGWGRSVDITDKLSNEQIEALKNIAEERNKRKIGIRSINDYQILKIINQEESRLLEMESFLLSNTHPNEIWPARRPTRVHISKVGRITAFWEIHITRPELIELVRDEYGMLPGTWKANRLENLYEAYKKYRGRKLTDEEIQEIRKVKEANPKKISAEWVSAKVQELFPGVQWANDLEKIRKKLGRHEEK